MGEEPIDIKDTEGDIIGTSVSGSGNLIGKNIQYTVQGNVFHINNISKDSLQYLKEIPAITRVLSSNVSQSQGRSEKFDIIEKHIEEILNLLRESDMKVGITTKEIKAGQVRISRIDLLIKRAIILLHQADRYWNTSARDIDINMFKAKYTEAYTLLKEANHLDEYNTEILLYMAEIQSKLEPNNSGKTQRLLDRIRNLLDTPKSKTDELHLAQAFFLLGVSQEHMDIDLLEDARVMFDQIGRRDWARQCSDLIQTERSSSSVNGKTWSKKGSVLGSLGRYEQAIECFDRALDIESRDCDTWSKKGSVLGSLGRYEQAIECFDRALDIEPTRTDLMKNKGTALHYLGRYEQAIECFDRALGIEPNDPDAWCAKGLSLACIEKYKRAIECFERALGIEPNDSDIWYNKAVSFHYLGMYERAVESYDRALEINPDSAIAWQGKGGALRKLEKYERALESYDRALEINPESAIAWQGKALTFNCLGEYDKASKCSSKAMTLGLKI